MSRYYFFLLNPHFIVAPYVVFTFLFIVVCEPAVRPVGLGWGEGGGGTHTCTFMFSAKHMFGHVRSLNSRGGDNCGDCAFTLYLAIFNF